MLRSSLERLNLVCNHVPIHRRDNVCGIVAAAQTSPLNSMVFYGDAINEWLELWKESESFLGPDTPPFVPFIRRLELIGLGATLQRHPHRNVIFLHRAIYSSPLIKLHVESVQMEDQCDWALLAKVIDCSLIR